MLPEIIIFRHKEKLERYINTYIVDNKFNSQAVFSVLPLKKEIVIDQIRSLKKQLITASGTKRLIIFYEFNKATIEAQNAFLKTLEEKNISNQFLLTSESLMNVLPTVLSRAKLVNLDSDYSEEVSSTDIQELIDHIYKSNNYSFLSRSAIQNIDSTQVLDILSSSIVYLSKYFKQKASYDTEVIKKGFKLYTLLQNNNLNPQLTIDSWLILLKKHMS